MIHDRSRDRRGRENIMASYKKILLCYDGSREGRKALRCGADLALDLKAETHLLSVVDMRSSIAQSAGLLTDVACGSFEKTARDILQEGVEWLTERGVTAQGHFAFGHPIDEIANLSNELHVDLVVVGHRCRTGLSRWWMGAGNTPLLDRISCSILVACSSAQEQEQEQAAASVLLRRSRLRPEIDKRDWLRRLPGGAGPGCASSAGSRVACGSAG
jgi:nucleotide-binding universal stress UspA family protein